MRLQAQLRGVIYCRAQAAIIGGHLSNLAYTMATLWGNVQAVPRQCSVLEVLRICTIISRLDIVDL